MTINSEVKAKIRKINGSDDSRGWNGNALQLRRAWESWTEQSVDGSGKSWKDLEQDLVNDMGSRAAWEFIKLQPMIASEYTYIEWCQCVDRFIANGKTDCYKPNSNQWIFACAHAEPNSGRTTLSLEQCQAYFTN